ncbi:MAG: hypothetical protein AAF614_18430 [Chloroflexota bacterium]
MLTCIAPEKIEPGDLVAYVEGTAETAVVHHILHCPHCQEEVAALRKADLLLTQQLYRDECPDAMQLLEYKVGFLEGEEKTAVAAHLSLCPHCTAELAQLAIEEAPATATSPSLLDQLRDTSYKILAAIRLPSAPQAGLAVRGQQEMGQIYQAEEFQIIVGLLAEDMFGDGVLFEGQVINMETGVPVSAGNVAVEDSAQAIWHQPINEFGHFEFEELASGSYQVQVELTAEKTKIHFALDVS